MSTTQRSEGMNAFFDGFINSTTTLQQFVIQYDNALKVKAQKELEANFASLNTTVACGSQSLIERQFQVEYTHEKFEEVQNEFRSRMNCFIKDTVKESIFNIYTIKEECMWEGKCVPKYYHVQFDPVLKEITCSCLLFEFRGIICRHSLLVLGQEDVHNVPSKYVLRRWSKNIRRKHTLIRAAYSSLQHDPKMQRYQTLCKQFYNLAEAACESECASDQLEKDLKCLAKKFGLSSSLKNNIVSEGGQLRYENVVPENPSYNTCRSSDVLVRSPVAVKRKGRPRTNRLKSTVESRCKKKSKATKKNSSTTPSQPNVRALNVSFPIIIISTNIVIFCYMLVMRVTLCTQVTTTCNVAQNPQDMEYASQTVQISQLSEVAPNGFMSLLSAVHNTFENI
ncbi:protein FAR-RED IMPAIRED RESPONSE 1-like [Vigna radiata var. radiata]|uniref:Protein FAR1-RELATED SEQUENCE n=1 Tax=Vigna radiata var. radiata TaxID=3916 RepID=A0A1S3UK31_VIGRR|nr:protein FAR-RED IMPAIRED RESPONSE 1-like [Vigna radiata var. radiata]